MLSDPPAFQGFFNDGVEPPDIGPIDCDVHPAVSNLGTLLPYLDEHWRIQVLERGMERDGLDSSSFPPRAPALSRPDWRPASGLPGGTAEALVKEAVEPFRSRFAILNPLYGVQSIGDDGMAVAFTRALNDWTAAEWLSFDTRLRASIVVTPQNPSAAAEEIGRLAPDRRYVQVLLLAAGELPLGRPFYWPIYEAAAKYDLPVAIHAGSSYRYAPSSLGWQSFYVAEYLDHPNVFQSQILNIITQGVFTRYPNLKFVCTESGFLWLPPFLWRALKSWRGLRFETPWVDRSPADIVRDHFRFTLQPSDAPAEPGLLERVLDQIGSDRILLFSTDYPHHHFDGVGALPAGLPADLVRRVCVDNPLETYPRLREVAS